MGKGQQIQKPSLIVVSAPSGAGKTTLCAKLLRDFANLKLSVSATTRAPRGQEVDGRDYLFMSPQAFRQAIDEDQFAEWALVHTHYYGTTRKFVDQCFNNHQSVLLDIDVQGAENLRKAYPTQCYCIFVSPPSLEELERRLRARNTDSNEVIQKRMQNAQSEMAQMSRFDEVLVNDDLEQTYQKLHALVLARIGKL